MTIAEDVASLWQGVKQVPPKGTEHAYYADLLRRLMQSKKQLEETGRKYSILPDLRELTRRTLVRIPAQHVPYLEVSVFDLISNPLKTHLQPYVSEFATTGADYELVSWFVRHAKKEPTLALDFKALQAWLEKNAPVESTPAMPTEGDSSSSDASSVSATPETTPSEPTATASDAASSESSASLSSDSSPSSETSKPQSDTTVPLPPSEGDGTVADRIFENG